MNKFSKVNISEHYKPGGITKKLSNYQWTLKDRSENIAKSREMLANDPDNIQLNNELESNIENFNHWKNQYQEFTEKPNNDPDVIKTILDSLIELSKHKVPTQLYMYMDELNKITISNEDINYLLDIFKAQRETFERTYFDDVAENIDEAGSRAEAESELPDQIFSEELRRKISKNYQKCIRLANYYDETKQYKKADFITNTLMKYKGK